MIKPVSVLYSKPLKTIPDKIVFKLKNAGKGNDTIYKMATNKGRYLGEMYASPMVHQRNDYYPDMPSCCVFHITNIFEKVKNIGVEDELIELAKKESLKGKAQGRLTASTYNSENPKEYKHVRYYNHGMIADDEYMQRAIENKVFYDADMPQSYSYQTAYMYLPVDKINI